ncbi:MAG: RagB/SusD family nutrient uptake outer membrane protein [Paramuribaculum sp.]|nr:RagB/SusD family nutrient uptake outer membrane protein [Paramuribaculum sp.]
MKKIFSKIAVAAAVASLGMGMVSCNDELNQYPIDYPANGAFWNNEGEFTGNVYALAAQFRSNYPANILFWAGELRAGTLTIDLINGSGAVNVEYIQNLYDASHAQFSTFGGYYGFIANLNELIEKTEEAGEDVLSDNVRNGLLATAHGWRAFAYFQMYRMYGGVPIRTKPDVVNGITNPDELYMERGTAEATLTFIKDDITKSLGYYGNTTWSIASGASKKYYWSKAATEMLAGEVYLWSGKVSTGDHTANASDVATAKGYFENVVNNYGYQLEKNYFDVWNKPANTEAIYSVCYSNTEDFYLDNNNKVQHYQNSGVQGQMLWSKSAGAGTTSWSIQDATGLGIRTDGGASRFQYFTDSPTAKQVAYTCWTPLSPSPNRYMYKNAMYFQYNENDTRRNMFFPQWNVKPEESELTYIANFDPQDHVLQGTFVLKLMPVIGQVSWSSNYVWINDAAIYRLPLAYMYLAEIANYEGDNAGVEKYINLVRERAYGDNWDEDVYGYTAGSFRENENAILREKDKEFLMEGQRWWDIRRLTAVKGGSDTDHFVFQPESCAGFGLDVVNNTWIVDQSGAPVETMTPVLKTSEAHKVLWPVDLTLLGSDPLVKQNPGYE